MSNQIASVSLALSFSLGGTPITKSFALGCPYQAQNDGTIDVPAAEMSATSHVIPFGSVAKATLVIVKNRTDQELSLKVNGSLVLQNVPVGGIVMFGQEALGMAADLTAVTLVTTTSETAAGYIDYFVFGDPV
jgi:hypothetical protein